MNDDFDKAFDELFGVRPTHPLKWWQLWRWNPEWECYAYRYKWLRDLVDKFKSR